MGIKLSKAIGHTVLSISLSKSKERLAREIGADYLVDCINKDSMNKNQNTCDLILNTTSTNH
jgi:D-arabinose 1-dehydrogenase-like Zn-dependent alcohol dehydrogenase